MYFLLSRDFYGKDQHGNLDANVPPTLEYFSFWAGVTKLLLRGWYFMSEQGARPGGETKQIWEVERVRQPIGVLVRFWSFGRLWGRKKMVKQQN